MRMIVSFAKTAQVRHLGHLDLMRSMQRALRRSGLPIRFSQGFNPHVLLSFASPLPVGASGGEELMDIAMQEEVTVEELLRRLGPAAPPSLPVLACRAVDDAHPKLMAQLVQAEYTATMAACEASRAMAGAIDAVLAQGSLVVLRKTKSGEKPSDIRPMMHMLSAADTAQGLCFAMRTSCTEQATLKPALLLQTLASRAGVDMPQDFRLHRVRLLGQKDGLSVPLMEL